MWEDTNNQPGGCWSFKVPSVNINDVWLQLCFHIITENVGNRQEVNDSVNGISFSPKKGFCIVKIWNSTTDIQNTDELNDSINVFMDKSTCIYKSHIESIDKDNKKKRKIQDFRNNIDRQEKNRLVEEITENKHTKLELMDLRKFLMDKDFQINQINIKIQIKKIIWIINTDSIPIQSLYIE